jgi:hypothetical protein
MVPVLLVGETGCPVSLRIFPGVNDLRTSSGLLSRHRRAWSMSSLNKVSGDGQDLAVELAQLREQLFVRGDFGPLGIGQARVRLPPPGLVLEQCQIAGPAAVHPDDTDHGGVVST